MVENNLRLEERIQDTPWLIIGYSRLEGLLQLVKLALELEIKNIYIAIDGSRNLGILEIQKTMHKEIAKLSSVFQNSNIHINQQLENLGVGIGVTSAIEWFFCNVDEGIILEDDLVPNIDFFKFCVLGLDVIRDDSNFLMVCGSQYFGDLSDGSAFSASIPQIWGWATTQNKWKTIRRMVFDLSAHLPFMSIKTSFINFWIVGTRRVFQGKIDTWDIPIVLACIFNEKKILLPPVNLVSNVGVDKSSSNTHESVFPLEISSHPLPHNFNWRNLDNKEISELFEKNIGSKVYKISFHHFFSPIFSIIFDWYRFPRHKRLNPYLERWRQLFS